MPNPCRVQTRKPDAATVPVADAPVIATAEPVAVLAPVATVPATAVPAAAAPAARTHAQLRQAICEQHLSACWDDLQANLHCVQCTAAASAATDAQFANTACCDPSQLTR